MSTSEKDLVIYVEELTAPTVPSSTSDKCSSTYTLRIEPQPVQAVHTLTLEEYAERCAEKIGENPGIIRRAADGGAAFLHGIDAWQKVLFFHRASGKWLSGRVRIRATLYPDAPKATP